VLVLLVPIGPGRRRGGRAGQRGDSSSAAGAVGERPVQQLLGAAGQLHDGHRRGAGGPPLQAPTMPLRTIGGARRRRGRAKLEAIIRSNTRLVRSMCARRRAPPRGPPRQPVGGLGSSTTSVAEPSEALRKPAIQSRSLR
jgi:hypothetical protein